MQDGCYPYENIHIWDKIINPTNHLFFASHMVGCIRKESHNILYLPEMCSTFIGEKSYSMKKKKKKKYSSK